MYFTLVHLNQHNHLTLLAGTLLLVQLFIQWAFWFVNGPFYSQHNVTLVVDLICFVEFALWMGTEQNKICDNTRLYFANDSECLLRAGCCKPRESNNYGMNFGKHVFSSGWLALWNVLGVECGDCFPFVLYFCCFTVMEFSYSVHSGIQCLWVSNNISSGKISYIH